MPPRVTREQLGEFRMSDAARRREGAIIVWSRVAREAVALYLDAIDRDTHATVVLTIAVDTKG